MPFNSTKNLQAWNAKGWIPGPDEVEKGYFKRIELLDHFFSHPPEDIDCFLTDRDWEGAYRHIQIFDFSTDWIVAYYSDKGLSFFQGAATWITVKDHYRIPMIQLRKKFEEGPLFRLHKREEVLAHEAVHAARMEFDEPFFEEFFAYRTSSHFFYKVFGPLFERPWETYLFIFLLLFPIAVEVALFFFENIGLFSLLRYAPLVYFILLLFRLGFFHLTLFLAKRKLSSLIKDSEKTWAVLVRLKDREIFKFAFHTKRWIKMFIRKQISFRWEMLKRIYF